jgi:negative regulator of replication initiation
MRMHKIDVDQDVFDYLKNNAEPFTDTPNDVLRRLLLGNERKVTDFSPRYGETVSKNPPPVPAGTPKALEHILQVVYLTHFLSISRSKATKNVAVMHGVATQTVLDKYCRQLGITAAEFDRLLSETGLIGLKKKLYSKFNGHREVINNYLNQPQ